MRFLVDECIKGVKKSHANVDRVIDVLGPGTTDKQILHYVSTTNHIIITSDRGLALSLIIRNKPVVFRCGLGVFFIRATAKKHPKLLGPVLSHQLQNFVVLP